MGSDRSFVCHFHYLVFFVIFCLFILMTSSKTSLVMSLRCFLLTFQKIYFTFRYNGGLVKSLDLVILCTQRQLYIQQ